MSSSRKKEIRDLWSHARVYGLGSIINRLAGILLIPVYTHLLPASEFGIYAIVVIAGEMASIMASRGFSTAMVRVYLDANDDDQRAQVVSTALIGLSVLALIIALLATPAAYMASMFFFKSTEHQYLFELAFYANIIVFIFNLELDYFRVIKRPWTFLWFSTAKSLLMFTINIALVVYLHMGVYGIVLGTLLSIGLITIPMLLLLLKKLGIRVTPKYFKEMLRLGLPMIPSKTTDIVTQFTDKYFINFFFTTALIGKYALALRLSSLLQAFIASPFAQIWIVRRLETLGADGEDGHRDFAHIFTLFLAFITAAALSLSLFSPEIIGLISSNEYLGAMQLVPLLSLSFVLMPIDMNFQLGIIHAKRTHLLMMASFAAAAVNIPLMYFLVKNFGGQGAAGAMVLTNIVRLNMTAWLSVRYCQTRLRFEWGRSCSLIFAAAVSYLLSLAWVGEAVSLTIMGAKMLILVGYAGIAALIIWVPFGKTPRTPG